MARRARSSPAEHARDRRDLEILRALDAGENEYTIADRLGVSQSAVNRLRVESGCFETRKLPSRRKAP